MAERAKRAHAAYVIVLRYTAPLDEVDALMSRHVAWLKARHAAGAFVAWGRQVPREGGVILARGASREAVEALAADDPFITGGVAQAQVIAWSPSFLDPGVAGLVDPGRVDAGPIDD